ncbi:MAG TPA: endonuclease/exonuclease/phosphatase family protein [Phycisphaerales bacterium]|nr:endonuclease/exonuclease/phosphatase family protein [Phycisphaerales bacterium]
MRLLGLCIAGVLCVAGRLADAQPTELRVATFNIEDVRTSDLMRDDQPRVREIAEVIQRLRPNIILLNEIAYDWPGVDGAPADVAPGQNGSRFVERYMNQSMFEGVEPIRYRAYMWPSNTGRHSGFDLDHNSRIVNDYPEPGTSDTEGNPPPQTAEGRAFGGDAWGFGTYPGQYAMALLVDERLEVMADEVRTFRLLPWRYMSSPRAPVDPETGEPWYTDEEWAAFRLSSKSHWDVPVRLPSGAVVHVLCSHPTPPAFDGPEGRNKRRNADEIRFWNDYLDNKPYIVDDEGNEGGLRRGELFIILGDLNADPKEPAWEVNAIADLLEHPLLGPDPKPTANIAIEGLDPTDTAHWGKRAD